MSSENAPAAPNYSPITQGLSNLATTEQKAADTEGGTLGNYVNANEGTSNAAIGSDQGIASGESGIGNSINNQYENTYVPLESKYANEAQNYASPSQIDSQMGQAEGTAAQSGDQAIHNEQQQLESYGISPDSTRYQALTQQGKVQNAASVASAGNAARENTVQTGLGLEGNAINQGLVMPSMAAGADNVATQANAGAVNSGLATTQTAGSVLGTAPTYLSLANGSYGAYGSTLNNQFNNQLDQFKANQNSSSGLGALGGALLGMGTGGGSTVGGDLLSSAMAFIAKGGVVPAVGGDPPAHQPDADDNNGPYKKPFVDHHFYAFHGRDAQGKQLPLHMAVHHFFSTGHHIGAFNSPAEANDFIQRQTYGKSQHLAVGGPVGGAVDATDGAFVPPQLSPTGGAVTDDVPAVTNQGARVQLNAGEFVLPKDVTAWKGKEFFQKLIDKARTDEKEASAKPSFGPPRAPAGPRAPGPVSAPRPPNPRFTQPAVS